MKIQLIPISQLKVSDSIFRFFHGESEEPIQKWVALDHSLGNYGFCEPLLVWEGKKAFHVVKGFRRAFYAKDKRMPKVPCIVLPQSATIPNVLDILVTDHFNEIHASVVLKARFVCFALSLGIPRDVVRDRYLPLIGLEGHEAILQRCEQVFALPGEILDFCHEKRFSLRQCVQLTTYPKELLERIFSCRKKLALTASIIEELLENIGDFLRANGISVEAFFGQPEIEQLFASSLSPQKRTQKMRDWVREKRFPVVTRINERINGLQKEMNLPSNVNLHWDRTLENDGVSLNIKITKDQGWKKTLEDLKEPSVPAGIEEIIKTI